MGELKEKRVDTVAGVADDFPYLNDRGYPLPIVENLAYLLNKWDFIVKYNLLSKDIEVIHKGNRIVVNDVFAVSISSESIKAGLRINDDRTAKYITAIAWGNRYNPLQDYFTKCYKEAKTISGDALAELFEVFEFKECSDDEKELQFTLFKKWMLQVMVLAFNKGHKSPQGILVLQGEQGLGKTSFVKSLLPAFLVGAEKSLDVTNKDNQLECLKYGITEISEMGHSMKDKDRLKQFFTRSYDEIRPPYGKKADKVPRYTSFIGTVNDLTFLIDKTGERRYWVLAIKRINMDKLKKINIESVWAYIYSLTLAPDKNPYWLTYDEQARLNTWNEQFSVKSDLEQILVDNLNWSENKVYWCIYTASSLCEKLGISSSVNAAKMGRLLATYAEKGKIEKPKLKNGMGASKLWKLPPVYTD